MQRGGGHGPIKSFSMEGKGTAESTPPVEGQTAFRIFRVKIWADGSRGTRQHVPRHTARHLWGLGRLLGTSAAHVPQRPGPEAAPEKRGGAAKGRVSSLAKPFRSTMKSVRSTPGDRSLQILRKTRVAQ